MLELTFPRNGAILNKNHGIETAESLTVDFTGFCDVSGEITIGGVVADRLGRGFSAPVKLTEKFNKIKLELRSLQGIFTQEITVIWDKAAFNRYEFYIDDHSFFWSDIIRDKPKSIFDHFYLKHLKDMHSRYPMKVILNMFYRNDHADTPTLDQFPDCYKHEWEDNSDWMRLSFHSYSEFPDRPYQDATPEKLLADYDLLYNEIVRIAGEKSWVRPPVLHWAMATPDALRAMHTERGVKFINGAYYNADTGRRLQEAAGGENVFKASAIPTCDIGYFINLDEAEYLKKAKAWYHTDLDLIFTAGSGCCCNLVPLNEIKERLDKAFELAKSAKNTTFGIGSHEQYSFPYYKAYEPDHLQRLELAVKTMTEHDCTPVWFDDGLLGNTAWEK